MGGGRDRKLVRIVRGFQNESFGTHANGMKMTLEKNNRAVIS